MTEALTHEIETAIEQVAAVDDLAERYRAARERRGIIADGDRGLREIQQAVVLELKQDRSWREVGEVIGVTGSRAEQISRGA